MANINEIQEVAELLGMATEEDAEKFINFLEESGYETYKGIDERQWLELVQACFGRE